MSASNILTRDHMVSGQIHKKVRKYIKDDLLKPNVKLIDLANGIENKIKELTNYDPANPLAGGVAFPTGLSVNQCAAHWTPNPGDTTQTLGTDDLIKIDWGVHVNGYITDGAFSFSFNDKFDPLIKASEEATHNAMKMAGPGASLGEIGKVTQEIIESYEIELDGKTVALKSIGDLSGHQIGRYQIHCGKPVPNVLWEPLMNNPMYKMREGEVYAIETFPSTGSGVINEDSNPNNCSHYMANYNNHLKYNDDIVNQSKYTVDMNSRFKTLAFCKRWMDNEKMYDSSTQKKFENVVNEKMYEPYPPLYDSQTGAYVAQTEHTVFINSAGAIPLN